MNTDLDRELAQLARELQPVRVRVPLQAKPLPNTQPQAPVSREIPRRWKV